MFELRPMTVADIPEAVELWRNTEGISLFRSDSPEGIARYLNRNPGLSVICRWAGNLAGAAMAGHDGRRGFLHHVAVVPQYRRRGIGRAMVEWCLRALQAEGIGRCHILVDVGNVDALAFWNRLGWEPRPLLHLLSFTIDSERA